nr:hypothetical protein Itr_chr12CG15370 [Ipomoea trifida]
MNNTVLFTNHTTFLVPLSFPHQEIEAIGPFLEISQQQQVTETISFVGAASSHRATVVANHQGLRRATAN